MIDLKITYKTPTLIKLSILNLLERNGKNFSDITDVIFMVKLSADSTDEIALISKDLKAANGVTLDIPNEIINIQLSTTTDFETGKLTPGQYLICVAIEFNDSGNYIEDYDPNFQSRIIILADKIRK